MKLSNKISNSSLLHPLLFAILPIISLWATNFSRMSAQDTLHPLLGAVLAAIIMYFIFKLFLREGGQAGLLSTLILFLYFSYGHIFVMIREITESSTLQLRQVKYCRQISIKFVTTQL